MNLNRPDGVTAHQQRREFNALKWLNRKHLQTRPGDTELEARISAYELAFRMQSEAPELVDLSGETPATRRLYGLDDPVTAGFGRQCLLARRMAESGVRYTMLVHGVQIGAHSWDDHNNVQGGMIRHSREVDQPVAGLLTDLAQRGLLEETLVVWASEMGRTPFRNGGLGKTPGREHNSWNLVMWMAGGNVNGGTSAGTTDEFGLRSVGEEIHIRDVHALLLQVRVQEIEVAIASVTRQEHDAEPLPDGFPTLRFTHCHRRLSVRTSPRTSCRTPLRTPRHDSAPRARRRFAARKGAEPVP